MICRPALAAEPVRKDVAGDYKDERGIAGNVMLTGRIRSLSMCSRMCVATACNHISTGD